MTELDDQPEEAPPAEEDGRVLSIHVGHSANCSSVGSVVDFLFVSGVLGAAVLSAFTVLVQRRAGSREQPTGEVDAEEADEADD